MKKAASVQSIANEIVLDQPAGKITNVSTKVAVLQEGQNDPLNEQNREII